MTQRDNPFPHRDLGDKSKRGEDIKRFQKACDRALKQRNQPKKFLVGEHDGVLGPQTIRAATRTGLVLGLNDATVVAIEHGRITIAVQTLVRRPDLRNDRQRARGHRFMDDWRDRRAEAASKQDCDPATAAMQLLLRNAAAAHYTMGASRWQGIAERLIAARGRFPAYSDCSSSFTWAWWQVLGDGEDVLNGASWRAGYTGTLLSHGKRVTSDVEGAAALYGSGFPGKHVVYCLGDGKGISQGSEAAPFLVDLDYRSDLMELRTYT